MEKPAQARKGTSESTTYLLDLDLEQFLKMEKHIKADRGNDVVVGLWSTDKDKMEKIFKLMQCSLCRKICPKTSSLCAQGHLLCNSCNVKWIQRCCFEKIDEFGGRSRCLDVLESFNLQLYSFMLDNFEIEFRCENFERGCKEILKPEKVGDHRLECEFRAIIACPYPDCPTANLLRPELLNHLLESHGSLYVKLEPDVKRKLEILFTESIKKYSWTPAIFTFSGHHLLLTLEYEEDQMRIWFYRLEKLENSADECRIEMKLFHDDEEAFFKLGGLSKDFFRSPFSRAKSIFTWDISEFMEKFVSKRANLNRMMVEIVAYFHSEM